MKIVVLALMLCFSFPAYAGSQFIVWEKAIDEKFRAAYLAKTGEKIQEPPLESEDGLFYMVGSWRVSEKQLDELKADRDITAKSDDIKTQKDTPPDGWVQKIVIEALE